MRHLFTLLFLASSLQCFGQIARDSEPTAPIVVPVAAAQSHDIQPDYTRQEPVVYICDSETAKAYHRSKGCRTLARCTQGVVKGTKKEAEEHGRVPCRVCY
jgi:hypothetical protein